MCILELKTTKDQEGVLISFKVANFVKGSWRKIRCRVPFFFCKY